MFLLLLSSNCICVASLFLLYSNLLSCVVFCVFALATHGCPTTAISAPFSEFLSCSVSCVSILFLLSSWWFSPSCIELTRADKQRTPSCSRKLLYSLVSFPHLCLLLMRPVSGVATCTHCRLLVYGALFRPTARLIACMVHLCLRLSLSVCLSLPIYPSALSY